MADQPAVTTSYGLVAFSGMRDIPSTATKSTISHPLIGVESD
jgi:hypothetical protein